MNNKKYKVGAFIIDVAGHRVYEGENVKNIEPRVLSALHYFLEHAGEVVTRETLITEVWADIIVTDHAVTQCIGNIRKIFNDRATEPKFIETIPKRGYRFIADVSVIEEVVEKTEIEVAIQDPVTITEKTPQTLSQEAILPAEKKFTLNWPWAIAVIILSALLLKDLFTTKETITSKKDDEEPAIKIVPTEKFTNLPGVEYYPRMSPDERFVAYVWEDENRPSDLFIQSVEHADSPRRQLTFTDSKEAHPAWSPEGDRVAYIQYSGTQDCQVKIINIHSLKEMFEASCNIDQNIGVHLSWSPDGKKLAIPHFEEGENTRGLIIHEIDSNKRERVKCHYQCDYIDFDVSWSPDNQFLAVTRLTTMLSNDLFLYEVNDLKKPEKQLTNTGHQIIGHAWMKDSKRIIFSSAVNGYPGLYAVHKDTLAIERVNVTGIDENANMLFPNIVDDNLTFVAQKQQFFISRVDLPKLSDRSLPELPVKPLIRTNSFSIDPTYSEVHKQLAYVSDQSGYFEIWSADLKSPKFHQLTTLEKSVMSPKWSPNGKYVTFIASDIEVDTSALYLLEVNTGHAYPLRTELSDFWVPEWSHDSETIFVAAKQEGNQKLFSIPIDGSPSSVVVENGLYGKMSSDGQSFFYVKKGKPGLWHHNLKTGSQQLIIPELEDFNWGNWDLSSEGVYYLTSNSSVDVINFYNLDTEESFPLAKVPKLTISKFNTGVFEVIEETHSLVFVQNGLLQGDVFISDLSSF